MQIPDLQIPLAFIDTEKICQIFIKDQIWPAKMVWAKRFTHFKQKFDSVWSILVVDVENGDNKEIITKRRYNEDELILNEMILMMPIADCAWK